MSGHTPFAASDATQKNRPGAEAPSPRNTHMLKVADTVAERKPQKPRIVPTPPKFHTVSDLRKAQLWLDAEVAGAGGKVTSKVADLTQTPDRWGE